MEQIVMKFLFPTFSLVAAALALLSAESLAGPVKLVAVETKAALPPEADQIVFGNHPKAGSEVKATFLVWPDDESSIVEIKEKKCKVTEVVDGANGQPVDIKVDFDSFPRVSKDGKVAVHAVEFPLPAEPRSGQIKVSGIITVVAAKGVKTEKIDGLTLAENANLKAGELSLSVDELTVKGGKTEFELKSSKPMSGIKEVRFFKPDGTALKLEQSGRSRMSGFGGYSESWSMQLDGEAKEVKVEIDLHQNTAEKEIPFDFVLPSSL